MVVRLLSNSFTVDLQDGYSGHRDQLITVPLWSVSVSLN